MALKALVCDTLGAQEVRRTQILGRKAAGSTVVSAIGELMAFDIARCVTTLSVMSLLTSSLSAARADAAFDVRRQYVRYARAYDTGNLAAFGTLLTPGCSVVENYDAKPWPLMSDIRLYLSRYGHSLELQVMYVQVKGNSATVLVDEVYSPNPAFVYTPVRRRVPGFRRKRRDLWVRGPAGWRLKTVHVLYANPTPVA